MDFNAIIKNTFLKFLNNIGFSVIEDNKTKVVFKSEKITIRFIYSSYEGEYYYFVKLNSEEREYEDFLVERYLKFRKFYSFLWKIVKRNNPQLWATQRFKCLMKFQDSLLKGNKDFYSNLARYANETDRRYTNKFTKQSDKIKKQDLA